MRKRVYLLKIDQKTKCYCPPHQSMGKTFTNEKKRQKPN